MIYIGEERWEGGWLRKRGGSGLTIWHVGSDLGDANYLKKHVLSTLNICYFRLRIFSVLLLQELVGSVPEGFDGYFASRFPRLFIEVYKVVCRHCREEKGFHKYFRNNAV